MLARNWLGSLLCLLFACAGGVVNLQPHETSQGAAWSGTALLLDYELNSTDPETLQSGCRLILSNKSDGKTYQFQLPGAGGKRNDVLLDAPPGVYVGKDLKCPHYMKWDLVDFLRGDFEIVADHLNYLGLVRFEFDPAGGPLKVLTGDQATVAKSLRANLAELPKSWQSAFMDPFTHRPIMPAMLGSKASFRMDIHARKFVLQGQKGASTTDLENQLKVCDLTEQKNFPYRVGTLDYQATFEDQALKDLKKGGENAFSGAFLDCLDRSLHAFRPATPARIEVTVEI